MKIPVPVIIVSSPEIAERTQLFVPLLVLIYIKNVSVFLRNILQYLKVAAPLKVSVTGTLCRRRGRAENNTCLRITLPNFLHHIFQIFTVQLLRNQNGLPISSCMVSTHICIHIVCTQHHRNNVWLVLCHTLLDIFQRPNRVGGGNSRINHNVLRSPQILFQILFKNLRYRVISFRMYKSVGNRIPRKHPCQRPVTFYLIHNFLLQSVQLSFSPGLSFCRLSVYRSKLPAAIL